MDLLAAVMQRSLIYDVSRHIAHRCGWQRSRRQVAIAHRREECTALRAQRRPEWTVQRGEVGLLRRRDTSVPCLEAIDCARHLRSARLDSTRFAAVFNIDAEHHIAGCRFLPVCSAGLRGERAYAREDDRIGRCRTRQRSANPTIIRIAHLELLAAP